VLKITIRLAIYTHTEGALIFYKTTHDIFEQRRLGETFFENLTYNSMLKYRVYCYHTCNHLLKTVISATNHS